MKLTMKDEFKTTAEELFTTLIDQQVNFKLLLNISHFG